MQDEKTRDQYLFVCTGSRCHELADTDEEGASILQKKLKACVKDKGLKEKIRVSKSGCLGACESAPNIMFQPDNRMCSHVTSDDFDEIIKTLEEKSE